MLEENYKATSRNGHELKDMYNPETNTLDIRSNGAYPSNVLSNPLQQQFSFRRHDMWQHGGISSIVEETRHQ